MLILLSVMLDLLILQFLQIFLITLRQLLSSALQVTDRLFLTPDVFSESMGIWRIYINKQKQNFALPKKQGSIKYLKFFLTPIGFSF